MDSWKGLLIGMTLVAIFSYAILNFGGILQIQNGVNDTIFNNPALKPFNKTITNNLNNLQIQTNLQQNASDAEQASEQNPSGALVLISIFKSFSKFSGFLYSFGAGFIGLIGYLINDPMIIGVLFSLIIIVVIYSFWRMIKWGQ